MKVYTLRRKFKGFDKGTEFYLVAESEFIGIKEFVLRTADLKLSLIISESELRKHFTLVKALR